MFKVIKNSCFFAFALLLINVSQVQAMSNGESQEHKLVNGFNFWSESNGKFNSEDFYSELYIAVLMDFTNGYKFIAGTKSTLDYHDKGNTKLRFKHSYIRLELAKKGIAKLGSWDYGVAYRYELPTTRGHQQAGSLGYLQIRPQLSNSWGRFSLLLRNPFRFHLQRNGYQIFTEPGKPAQKGNNLFKYMLEFIPAYQISDNLVLEGYFSPALNLKGADRGTTGVKWSGEYYHEVYLGYTIPSWGDLQLAIGYVGYTEFTSFKEIDPFNGTNEYFLRVTKSF